MISGAAATPWQLWPPNHRLRDVVLSYTATTTCGSASASLSVGSNEAVNDTGDGNTAPDWVIVDAHHVKLRSERAARGAGRIYTITITATDSAGGTSSQATTVLAPHDMSK